MLDGLRILAALSVLGYHYMAPSVLHAIWGTSTAPSSRTPTMRVAEYGFLGVEFFFLISGFVICMSCWGRTPQDFFVSRITRLFPAYWFAVLFTVVVILLIPSPGLVSKPSVDPSHVLTNMTMAPGPLQTTPIDGVVWTLWVEARFYLLMALMMCWGLTYRRMLVFCGGWLFAGVIVMDAHLDALDEFVMTRYCGLFVAGIAVYMMRRFGSNLLLWGLLGFAWVFELTMLHWRLADPESSHGHRFSWLLSATLLTLGLVLVIGVAIGPLERIQWGWLTTAGALTYPLYLIHQQYGSQMMALLHDSYPWLPRGVILGYAAASSLLLAWMVHRFVEKPTAKVLKRGLARSFAVQTDR